MSIQAFGPRGLTFNLSSTQTASAPVQITSSVGNCFTHQFINTSSNPVWFAFGASNANVVAALPAAGTPARGVCILPNEIVIYNLVPNPYISVICRAGQTGNLEVTPGEGM